jgi:hypothetical protein
MQIEKVSKTQFSIIHKIKILITGLLAKKYYVLKTISVHEENATVCFNRNFITGIQFLFIVTLSRNPAHSIYCSKDMLEMGYKDRIIKLQHTVLMEMEMSSSLVNVFLCELLKICILFIIIPKRFTTSGNSFAPPQHEMACKLQAFHTFKLYVSTCCFD